jgi:hypothetical protein
MATIIAVDPCDFDRMRPRLIACMQFEQLDRDRDGFLARDKAVTTVSTIAARFDLNRDGGLEPRRASGADLDYEMMRQTSGSTPDAAPAGGRNAHAFRSGNSLRLPAWAGDASLLPDDEDALTVRYGAAVDAEGGADDARQPRLRILLSAYSLEPNTSSERGVGWRWALDLAAAGHEVWVITSARNAGAIESALGRSPSQPALHLPTCRPGTWKRWKRGVRAFSPLWAWGAHRVARGLSDRVAFDAGFEVKDSTVETARRVTKLKGLRDKAPRSL